MKKKMIRSIRHEAGKKALTYAIIPFFITMFISTKLVMSGVDIQASSNSNIIQERLLIIFTVGFILLPISYLFGRRVRRLVMPIVKQRIEARLKILSKLKEVRNELSQCEDESIEKIIALKKDREELLSAWEKFKTSLTDTKKRSVREYERLRRQFEGSIKTEEQLFALQSAQAKFEQRSEKADDLMLDNLSWVNQQKEALEELYEKTISDQKRIAEDFLKIQSENEEDIAQNESELFELYSLS